VFRALRLLIVAAIGAGLGLGSVWLALNHPRLDFSRHIGPWIVHDSGSTSDPYSRARAAREGLIGLGAAEGLAFSAYADSNGQALDPKCHILVEGKMPEAKLWTLTASDHTGRNGTNPAGRIGYASDSAVFHGDGSVSVLFGPTARAGNFVPTTGLSDLTITLRAYSAALAATNLEDINLPIIRVISCNEGSGS
jgi:hypothetical protein